ncbi:hypothetical protein M409DRAFT_24500 [Zasmidium cellare ATCC 36951]|uniref:DUF7730 domain-containing protein n=1 Tax=Zasmidium cellare ATCC 36951 TaxID=1080233 RepID=A0A6A6CEL0_ZASCE|nr:uncharacterized protein M409DRAFT_24500 [Zasmidium cellare ATCC 36951]KAF2165113.1 hypothetical protein M409DRAFT_24500 [Zasmidium cellare ATCC 36951]
MDQTNDKPFPFLSLPGELREKIYTHLLVRHRILISYNQTLPSRRDHQQATPSKKPKPKPTLKGLVAITSLATSPKTTSTTTFELPTPYATRNTAALLLTSRQLHHEGTHTLYTHNVFDFKTMPAVQPFLSLIGPRNRSLLTSIRLSSWNRLGWKLALNALAETNVREVEIAVWKFDTYEAQWEGFLRELGEGLGGEVGNVRFCVGGGEVWERGRGNVLGSGDVEAVGCRVRRGDWGVVRGC